MTTQKFVQRSARPEKLRLPASLVEHIRTDLSRIRKCWIGIGDIVCCNVGKGRVWIWDLRGMVDDFSSSKTRSSKEAPSAIYIIKNLSQETPRGILIEGCKQGGGVASLLRERVEEETGVPTRVTLYSPIIAIGENGDVRTIMLSNGMSLTDYLREVFGINGWSPAVHSSSTMVSIGEDDQWRIVPQIRTCVDAMHDTTIGFESTFAGLSSARIPLIYSQSPHPFAFPPPGVLIKNCVLERIVRDAVLFGEKPHIHFIIVSAPKGDGESEVFAWRNIGGVTETLAGIQRFERVMASLKRAPTPERLADLYHEHLIGTVVERVPLEDSEEMPITRIRIS